ncbi:dTDP-4-dehydrorhamnose 3,5-epimerase family protein [Flavobacterium yafengii]|uniref:dTDP-4-dehydrorhamnose 3,5-epimerase family protein n=1 Tax=Flavobacterium yafengii TaxID=3041253 RepID=UPI0024A8D66B|nr:dTDP-4-dehydrorhamnose 3,5-epimerase family protein [Flavobacterium yafengii]MDI5887449.1 dTDP-4-dehydrorhamnose 3,5-epimerase family protein [Flavobacterium yafengii]
MIQNPEIILGRSYQDERGKLTFVNDFNLSEIKRYYIIEHTDINIIRAWQGHKMEQKWFQVISGSFLVAVVKPDNWENPSFDIQIERFILKSDNTQVLHIPGGFANGFKALETNSKMIVFSDLTLEEAANDNFRFDSNLWFDWK